MSPSPTCRFAIRDMPFRYQRYAVSKVTMLRLVGHLLGPRDLLAAQWRCCQRDQEVSLEQPLGRRDGGVRGNEMN